MEALILLPTPGKCVQAPGAVNLPLLCAVIHRAGATTTLALLRFKDGLENLPM